MNCDKEHASMQIRLKKKGTCSREETAVKMCRRAMVSCLLVARGSLLRMSPGCEVVFFTRPFCLLSLLRLLSVGVSEAAVWPYGSVSFHPAALSCDWTALGSRGVWIPPRAAAAFIKVKEKRRKARLTTRVLSVSEANTEAGAMGSTDLVLTVSPTVMLCWVKLRGYVASAHFCSCCGQ